MFPILSSMTSVYFHHIDIQEYVQYIVSAAKSIPKCPFDTIQTTRQVVLLCTYPAHKLQTQMQKHWLPEYC